MNKAALAALLVLSCAHQGASSPPPDAPPPASGSVHAQTTSGSDGGASAPSARDPSRPARPQVDVTRSEGVPAERMRRILDVAVDPLQHCVPGTSGKMNVRVTSAGGTVHFMVEPGASLSPAARHCAIEALSQVYFEQTGSNVGGPGAPPSSFTSLLTVSW